MYKPISLLVALLLAAMPLTTRAQALNQDMQALQDICVGLRSALTLNDRDSLTTWGKKLKQYRKRPGYTSMNEEYFQRLSPIAEQDSLDGHYCFELEYVTMVLKNNVQPNFQLAALTRGGGAQVAHKVVPASGQLDFCIKECEGPLQMFIVAEREEGIAMTITVGGETVAVESPEAGVCQAAWQQPSTDKDVYFSLSNSSSQDTYCYIAFYQQPF